MQEEGTARRQHCRRLLAVRVLCDQAFFFFLHRAHAENGPRTNSPFATIANPRTLPVFNSRDTHGGIVQVLRFLVLPLPIQGRNISRSCAVRLFHSRTHPQQHRKRNRSSPSAARATDEEQQHEKTRRKTMRARETWGKRGITGETNTTKKKNDSQHLETRRCSLHTRSTEETQGAEVAAETAQLERTETTV